MTQAGSAEPRPEKQIPPAASSKGPPGGFNGLGIRSARSGVKRQIQNVQIVGDVEASGVVLASFGEILFLPYQKVASQIRRMVCSSFAWHQI